MDYIFFAFSALCVGFIVLLLILMMTRQDRQLLLRHILLAAAASAFYYYLEVSVFHKQITFYYLANLIPQALLFILLFVYLWRSTRN